MTNQIAIALGLVILVLIGADFLFLDGFSSLYLAKKITDLLDWMAFWR